MEKYKNVSSMSEVNDVLSKFQELYTNRNESELENFVKNRFSFTNGLVVLGSEMNQWCHREEEIIELIKTHWKLENNYWKKTDFKFGEAKIFANENVAWVISIGNTNSTISEIIGKEKISKEDALNIANKIANTLKNVEQGENYVWPFRFTCVLIKENASWKFHQMQFSLDSESWNHRYTDENYDKCVFEMSKDNSSGEAEEIRKVLGVFQDGYTKRDLNYVDDYMKEVFLLDANHKVGKADCDFDCGGTDNGGNGNRNDNGDGDGENNNGEVKLVVIGTDAEELCLGVEATRGIIESDWKYWGDFRFNAEDAIISINDNVAYFTTKAILNRVVTAEETLKWIKGGIKYDLESAKGTKEKLMHILCDTVDLLCESEKGEIYITPMRFSGVLVKQEEKWLITHLQYSDYGNGMPSVRIVK
jgi:hypothetical protein